MIASKGSSQGDWERAGAEHVFVVSVLVSPNTSEELLARELCNLQAKSLGNGKEQGLPLRAVGLFLFPPDYDGLSACAAMGGNGLGTNG